MLTVLVSKSEIILLNLNLEAGVKALRTMRLRVTLSYWKMQGPKSIPIASIFFQILIILQDHFQKAQIKPRFWVHNCIIYGKVQFGKPNYQPLSLEV